MKTIFETSLFRDKCYNPELGYPFTEINKETISEMESSTPQKTYDNILIILDNGHGEDTPGKRSPDGKFREYKFCREMVQAISEGLSTLGIPSVILVPEEKDISLSERVRRVNEIYDSNKDKIVFLISVHNNAAGNGSTWMSARGWSCYTSKGNTESDAIAKDLYVSAENIVGPKVLRKFNGDKKPDWEENFTILSKSKCPAVLTENFFQDNHQDVDYLTSESGFADVLNIHIEGIKTFLRNKKAIDF